MSSPGARHENSLARRCEVITHSDNKNLTANFLKNICRETEVDILTFNTRLLPDDQQSRPLLLGGIENLAPPVHA